MGVIRVTLKPQGLSAYIRTESISLIAPIVPQDAPIGFVPKGGANVITAIGPVAVMESPAEVARLISEAEASLISVEAGAIRPE